MRKFNLHQLCLHLANQFDRMQASSLLIICDLIQSNKKWSIYVHELWMENYMASSKLPFAREVLTGEWEVSSQSDFSDISHCVSLDGIPTCDCPTFGSSKIPCPGICSVFNRIENNLFEEKNLSMRWRLSSHPLYPSALSKLNLSAKAIAIAPASIESIQLPSQTELDMESYASIIYPSRRDVRYTQLNQAFKKLENKCIDNEHFFKLMMMNLCKFGNFMQGGDSAAFQIPCQPPRKRGAMSSTDDINMLVSI